MGEVLSELLDLREQLAGLKDEAGLLTRKRRSKRPKSV
jgi:hypothetical protein